MTELAIETLVGGILKGDRRSLARAITLVESRLDAHRISAGALVDTLQVVNVDNPDGLEKVGSNHFRAKAAGAVAETPAAGATVEQGYLEAPNVEVVTEMINMIEVQRGFEAYTKLIQTTGDIDTKAIATGEVR